MKRIIVLGLVFISCLVSAQEEVSVEKNLNSVQVGLFSVSFQKEFRLERKFTFRGEIGLMTGSSNVEFPDGQKVKSFMVVPFVNVEPRWYYSLDRRKRLNKNTANNSSNYFSLFTSFESASTAIVNTKDLEVAPCIKIVPEYGFRRGFGKKWFSEYSAGIGYRYNFFKKDDVYNIAKNQLYFDIQYKIGYVF